MLLFKLPRKIGKLNISHLVIFKTYETGCSFDTLNPRYMFQDIDFMIESCKSGTFHHFSYLESQYFF